MGGCFRGFIEDFNVRAENYPDRVFGHFNGEPVTSASLKTHSAALAAELRLKGLQVGGRVAVMMRNSKWSLPVLFGIARSGPSGYR